MRLRDLYDIHNMISFDILSERDYELLRKATIFYTAISQESIPNKYDFSKIEQISSRKIKTELQPVIYKNESISLESMKAKVVAFLSQLLTLSAEEDTFLTEFSNNNFLPELLFEDDELLARIRNHPMAFGRHALQDPSRTWITKGFYLNMTTLEQITTGSIVRGIVPIKRSPSLPSIGTAAPP